MLLPAQRGPEELTLLERLSRYAGQLYSLPRVAAEVLQLTRDPQVDTRRIKECLERDPALSAKLLRVVNSSLFGLSREVSDLTQALALLGTKPLKLLVLGFSLPDGLFRNLAGDLLTSYWQRALIRAVAARQLSSHLGPAAADELFLAGLLQEVGQLVLLQELGEPYVRFVRRMQNEGQLIPLVEQRTLGFDRIELSERLLEQWQVPHRLIAAIRRPDDVPPESGRPGSADRRAQLVHLAGLVAEWIVSGQAMPARELLSRGQRSAHLSAVELAELVADVQVQAQQLASVLNVEPPPGRQVTDLLLDSQAQLALVAAEAAGELASQQTMLGPGDLARLLDLEETRGIARQLRTSVAHLPSMPAPPPLADSLAPLASASAISPLEAAPRGVDPFDRLHQTGLRGRLAAVLRLCRQRRLSLSLVLVEMDRYQALVSAHGLSLAQTLFAELTAYCKELDPGSPEVVTMAEGRLALILAGADRHQAVDLAKQVLSWVRQQSQPTGDNRPEWSISLGAATVSLPARNFPSDDLLAGAQRLLSGAQASGGNSLKSMELY